MNIEPVVLLLADGIGIAAPGNRNAVTLANTPNLDSLWPRYPHGSLQASGEAIGLMEGEQTHTQHAYTIIGAGTAIQSALPRLQKEFGSKIFEENPTMREILDKSKRRNVALHLFVPVLRDNFAEYYAVLKTLIGGLAPLRFSNTELFLHLSLQQNTFESTLERIAQIADYLERKEIGKIASIAGEQYAQNTGRQWERTKKYLEMLQKKTKGKETVPIWQSYLEKQRKANVQMEFVLPQRLVDLEENHALLEERDVCLFTSPIQDSDEQVARALFAEEFNGWERKRFNALGFSLTNDYSGLLKTAFRQREIETTLSSYVADAKLTQMYICESRFFDTVTTYMHSEKTQATKGEDWISIPSPGDVQDFSKKPEMHTPWLTDVAVETINARNHNLIIVHIGSIAEVARSGNVPATISAVESVDTAIGKIWRATEHTNGTLVLASPFGMAEHMDSKNKPSISLNMVPILIANKKAIPRDLPIGTLADIAPTLIRLLRLEPAAEMEGRSLL